VLSVQMIMLEIQVLF